MLGVRLGLENLGNGYNEITLGSVGIRGLADRRSPSSRVTRIGSLLQSHPRRDMRRLWRTRLRIFSGPIAPIYSGEQGRYAGHSRSNIAHQDIALTQMRGGRLRPGQRLSLKWQAVRTPRGD
jgi:hypothetical protein